MHQTRWVLAAGALLGLGGVVAGALLEHAAARFVLQQHAADIAVRYQQLHAIVITALGLALRFCNVSPADRTWLTGSARFLTLGTIIFCGTLYALAFTGNTHAAYGAPIGGMNLMAGWVILAWMALRRAPGH